MAVEVQLQEMTVMSATLDEIQKQHQAIKTRVRPAFPQSALAPALLFALQHRSRGSYSRGGANVEKYATTLNKHKNLAWSTATGKIK